MNIKISLTVFYFYTSIDVVLKTLHSFLFKKDKICLMHEGKHENIQLGLITHNCILSVIFIT